MQVRSHRIFLADFCEVKLTEGAELLGVTMLGDGAYLLALEDLSQLAELRSLQNVRENKKMLWTDGVRLQCLGSVEKDDEVIHVFERVQDNAGMSKDQRVLRYTLEARLYLQTQALPKNAEILTVGMQEGKLRMWVLADSSGTLEERLFQIVRTGHKLETLDGYHRAYLATVIADPYVWHVFEHVVNPFTEGESE